MWNVLLETLGSMQNFHHISIKLKTHFHMIRCVCFRVCYTVGYFFLNGQFNACFVREWTICTTATSAPMEIWSHLIVWWTVDLCWKLQITDWPVSIHHVKMTTRTHSMQVGQHCQRRWSLCLFTNGRKLNGGLDKGKGVQWIMWVCCVYREAVDGPRVVDLRQTPSTGHSERRCVQLWHHTPGDSPEEWTLLCGGHGSEPQR